MNSGNSSGAESDRLLARFARFDDGHLGELALERGWITSAQLRKCQEESDLAKPRLPLARVLVERRLLTEAQIRELTPSSVDPGVPSQARSGTEFGRFVLTAEIGRGGMGVVHRAWQKDIGRWVALKRLKLEAVGGALGRFTQEGRLAAQIVHPNLVPIYEVGTHEGVPYIAMALIEGGSLDSREVPIRRALEVVEQIARAVHDLHKAGIVHRDIKPANLLVDASDRVYLGDFSLARHDDGPGLTKPGFMLGTAAFAPPEQIRGSFDKVGPRSDVYSLGATLYALLAGRPPFEGKDFLEVMNRSLNTDPAPIRSIRPEVNHQIQTIISKAMGKIPADRYASALALADDVRRYLNGETLLARPPGAIEKIVRTLPRGRVAALTIAVLVLLGASTWFAVETSRAGKAGRLEQLVHPLESRISETRKDLYIRGSKIIPELRELSRELAALEARLPTSEFADRPEPWILLGEGWRLIGMREAAEKALDRADRLAPDNGRVNYELARLHLERAGFALLITDAVARERVYRDCVKKAKERLDVALRRPGQPTELERDLQRAYAAYLGASVEVGTLCRNALGKFGEVPGAEEFHVLLGMLEAGAGVGHFTNALSIRPHFPQAYFGRGTLRMLTDSAGSLADLDAALALNPNLIEAYLQRGTLANFAGRPQDAYDDFTRFLGGVRAEDPLRYPGLVNRSIALGKLGRPEERLADLNQAIRLEPTQPGAYLNRISVAEERGDHEAALADCETILRLDAGSVPGYVKRAFVRWSISGPGEAMLDLAQAIKLQPANVEAGSGLIDAISRLEKDGLKTDAEYACLETLGHLMERALAARPDWSEGHFTLGNLHYRTAQRLFNLKSANRGDLESCVKECGLAIDAFTSAVALGAPLAQVQRAAAGIILGMTLHDLDRDPLKAYEGAIRDCTTLLEADPRNGPALINRASALVNRGEYLRGKNQDGRPDFLRAWEDASAALVFEATKASATKLLETLRTYLGKE